MSLKGILSAIAVASASLTAVQAAPFTLRGVVNGHEGEYIYLYYSNESGRVTDSCKVSGHAFSFKGDVQSLYTEATLALKKLGRTIDEEAYNNSIYFYMESADMTVAINVFSLKNAVFTGSASQKDADEFSASVAGEQYLMQMYNHEYYQTRDEAVRDSINNLLEPIRKSYKEKSLGFVKSHPDAFVSAVNLRSLMSDMNLDTLKALYGGLTERVKADDSGKEILSEITAREKVEPGKPAPLFTATDINGKKFSLEKLRGKYVVIDFWASWCVPCRQSNPHMKELYERYGKKGLDFVYVSDDDSNPAAWRAAVKKDGLEKFHHVLRGLKFIDRASYKMDRSNDISDKYAIHYLPTKFLVDKKGNIVGKFESDELDAKLKEIFGE